MIRSFKNFVRLDETVATKYASFKNRILILGYGSVGQPILELIIRHIKVDPNKITVLEKDDHSELFNKRQKGSGVVYIPNKEITKSNYKTEFAKYAGDGDLLINCSLNIGAEELIEWCLDNGVMQVDTSLERWGDDQDEDIPNLAERTLYYEHRQMRKMFGDTKGKATVCVTHGANPGYVTHLTKRALLELASLKKKKTTVPSSKEEWAKLMEILGVKVVHIAERDTQIIDEPKEKDEFVNTWSCEGFWAEGRAPAELGWGTHEDNQPEGGKTQGWSAYLLQPGVTTLVKSWVPKGGQYNGFLVQHSEAITISDYFTTEDGKFRPSVYYIYQPCDAAITSIHEMRGKELDLQKQNRIVKDEIVSGIDELGVLLLGDDFCFWHGSQLSIEGARNMIEGENATSMQVAGSLLAAIVWMINNPKEGYIEPESLPFEEILDIGDQYWKPIVSKLTDWTPNQDVNSLFYREYDSTNPCKLENFRVWT